jgi:hypothetical protein
MLCDAKTRFVVFASDANLQANMNSSDLGDEHVVKRRRIWTDVEWTMLDLSVPPTPGIREPGSPGTAIAALAYFAEEAVIPPVCVPPLNATLNPQSLSDISSAPPSSFFQVSDNEDAESEESYSDEDDSESLPDDQWNDNQSIVLQAETMYGPEFQNYAQRVSVGITMFPEYHSAVVVPGRFLNLVDIRDFHSCHFGYSRVLTGTDLSIWDQMRAIRRVEGQKVSVFICAPGRRRNGQLHLCDDNHEYNLSQILDFLKVGIVPLQAMICVLDCSVLQEDVVIPLAPNTHIMLYSGHPNDILHRFQQDVFWQYEQLVQASGRVLMSRWLAELHNFPIFVNSNGPIHMFDFYVPDDSDEETYVDSLPSSWILGIDE